MAIQVITLDDLNEFRYLLLNDFKELLTSSERKSRLDFFVSFFIKEKKKGIKN